MSVGRSSLVLASGTVVSRILGFINAVVLARTVGLVGSGADAFALANQLPNNIYAIVAGGVLSAVLVPHIVKSGLNSDGGEKYINKLLTLGISVFAVIALLATIAAPLWVGLYAQQSSGAGELGFSEADIRLAVAFAWWCLPQVFFYAIYSLLGELLNAKGLFGPFTWAPVLNNIVAIGGMLWLGGAFSGAVTSAADWGSIEIAILAGSATAGVATQALILFIFLGRAGIQFRPDFRFRGVGLGDTGRAATWTLGMILVTQLAGLLQSNIASLATTNGDPGLAVLRFGWLIFMLPHSVITVSLGTAYFTRMSHSAQHENWTALSDDIRESISRVGFFIVASSAIIWTVAPDIAAIFSRNEFNALSRVVQAFVVGLIAYSTIFIFQRVFYALGDTRTPFWIQLGSSSLYAIVISVGSPLVPLPQLAEFLALTLSGTIWAQAIALAIVLHRRIGSLFDHTELRAFTVYLVSMVPTAVAGWLLHPIAGEILARAGIRWEIANVLSAGITTVVMTAIYLGVVFALKDPTARAILAPLRNRGNNRA
ncbi:MAG: murein biosynthesis integral membrane protein MurJ [Microbacteriaceae bacterium]